MSFNPLAAIVWTWEALGLLWLAGYAFTKRTLRSQSLPARLSNIALGVLGFAFLGMPWFERGWLALRFLAGALFAAWARITLGANWSGRPSVKAGHELVVKGPYAIARHPIYTGLLLGVAGTALAVGQWRAVIGFVLILIAFAAKITHEEKLMMQTFPDSYPDYRKRVKALIPGVL